MDSQHKGWEKEQQMAMSSNWTVENVLWRQVESALAPQGKSPINRYVSMDSSWQNPDYLVGILDNQISPLFKVEYWILPQMFWLWEKIWHTRHFYPTFCNCLRLQRHETEDATYSDAVGSPLAGAAASLSTLQAWSQEMHPETHLGLSPKFCYKKTWSQSQSWNMGNMVIWELWHPFILFMYLFVY